MANHNLKQSAGAIIFSKYTQRCLFLLRSDEHVWGFVGGKVEPGENLVRGLQREIIEEIGEIPDIERLIPLEKFTNIKKRFEYHLYMAIVADEFLPNLNEEHLGYSWAEIDLYPMPLHPDVEDTLNDEDIINKINIIMDLFI